MTKKEDPPVVVPPTPRTPAYRPLVTRSQRRDVAVCDLCGSVVSLRDAHTAVCPGT